MQNKKKDFKIELALLINKIKRKLHYIIIITLLSLIASTIITLFVIKNQYQAEAQIFLKQAETAKTDESKMVSNYIMFMNGNTLHDKIENRLALSDGEVKKAINITNQENTNIIIIKATTSSPTLSKNIVDELITSSIEQVNELLDVDSISLVSSAKLPTDPVYPILINNLIIAAILGIILGFVSIILSYSLDTRIHSKEQLESLSELPVLGVIPDFENKR